MKMRLFIAINFGENELDAFEAARDRLRERAGRANYSRRENLHLTLAFLGEQPQARLPDARAAMLAAAAGSQPFTLRFERSGRFRREGGDIWWLGAADCPALTALQSRLASELRARGFALEDRRFYPHLTLARRVFGAADPRSLLAGAVPCRVSGMSLMLSERPEGKLTYTELFRAPFPR